MKAIYSLSIFLGLLIIVSIPLVLSIKNSVSVTGMIIAENAKEIPEFKTYTKAVCEEKNDFIFCQDELFANCNGYEFKLPRGERIPVRCGTLLFELPENEVDGDGIFGKDWDDPRED